MGRWRLLDAKQPAAGQHGGSKTVVQSTVGQWLPGAYCSLENNLAGSYGQVWESNELLPPLMDCGADMRMSGRDELEQWCRLRACRCQVTFRALTRHFVNGRDYEVLLSGVEESSSISGQATSNAETCNPTLEGLGPITLRRHRKNLPPTYTSNPNLPGRAA
jgi:hypothetical protein